MSAGTLTVINDRRSILVYEGVPGPDSLVASHTQGGESMDLWGTLIPNGDWCRADYELIPMLEVWPGTMLRQKGGRRD